MLVLLVSATERQVIGQTMKEVDRDICPAAVRPLDTPWTRLPESKIEAFPVIPFDRTGTTG